MENENNSEFFVVDKNLRHAFKLVRNCEGLQAEVKLKTRDKNVPKYVYVDAIEVIDQVAAAMNMEERLIAYSKLMARLK